MEWEDLGEMIGLSGLVIAFIYGSQQVRKRIDKNDDQLGVIARFNHRNRSTSKDINEAYDRDLNVLMESNFQPISKRSFENTDIYEVMFQDKLFTKNYFNLNLPYIAVVAIINL